jgi:hypothetical protein
MTKHSKVKCKSIITKKDSKTLCPEVYTMYTKILTTISKIIEQRFDPEFHATILRHKTELL